MQKHIKTLKSYIQNMPKNQRKEFAEKCGTSLGQLMQIYYGRRKCEINLAIQIHKNSNNAVTCDDLRPDVDFLFLRENAGKL